MNCPKCKSDIKQEDFFCKVCGCSLNKMSLQNNQEIPNVVNSNKDNNDNNNNKDNNDNNNNKESIIKDISKYLKKCYIPFAIIYFIYMLVNRSLYNQCSHLTGDLSCSMSYFMIGIIYTFAYFIIFVPFLSVSTLNSLKKFNDNETKIKIVDLIVMITTGFTVIFLVNKLDVGAFFLAPIIVLLYFSKEDISKKTSQIVCSVLIISMLVASSLLEYFPYKVINSYNLVVLPIVTIIFYLMNQQKIKFKTNKIVPIVLLLFLLTFSSYPFLLKNTRSFAENVKKKI